MNDRINSFLVFGFLIATNIYTVSPVAAQVNGPPARVNSAHNGKTSQPNARTGGGNMPGTNTPGNANQGGAQDTIGAASNRGGMSGANAAQGVAPGGAPGGAPGIGGTGGPAAGKPR